MNGDELLKLPTAKAALILETLLTFILAAGMLQFYILLSMRSEVSRINERQLINSERIIVLEEKFAAMAKVQVGLEESKKLK